MKDDVDALACAMHERAITNIAHELLDAGIFEGLEVEHAHALALGSEPRDDLATEHSSAPGDQTALVGVSHGCAAIVPDGAPRHNPRQGARRRASDLVDTRLPPT